MNIVEEIRPKEAGELWKGDSGKKYVTVYRKGSLCFHDLERRGSTGYLDFKRNDISAWVCTDEPIHNKNGWTRLFPPVEDDSVEKVVFERLHFGRIKGENGAHYTSIISTSATSPKLEVIRDKSPMKMILEIPKED